MNRYMDRCIDRLIERDLGIFGAVLIQGPKWCGKTTTAQRFAESSANLLRLERKLVKRGKKPPAAKLIVIGFGMPAHKMTEGVIVAPVDTLAP